MPKNEVLACTFLAFILCSYLFVMPIRNLVGVDEWGYLETFNVDGDLSLSAYQDAYYWNPQMAGSPNAEWSISFTDEMIMYVKNTASEKGYIAAGAWFDRAFVPLGRRVPVERDIYIEFDAMLDFANYEPNAWLRIAISNELYLPFNERVSHVELDFWDSPDTYSGPLRGVVYQDENTTKLHMDQISMDIWRHYQFNLYEILKNLTESTKGKNYLSPENFLQLMGSYVIVEYDRTVIEVRLHIRDLKLSKPIKPRLPTPYDEASLLSYLRTLAPADIPVVRSPLNPPPLTNALPQIEINGKQLLADDTPIVLKGGGEDYRWILDNNWIFDQITKYPKFNAIRLSFRMITTFDSAYSNIDFTLLDQVLVKLETMHIYAILDAHHFFLPLIHEDLWVQQWMEIAKYYKNSTVVAAYEICNEPFYDYGSWLNKWLDREWINWKTNRTTNAYIHAAEAIKAIDAKPIVFNVQYVDSETLPQLFAITNTLLTFHPWERDAATLEQAQLHASELSSFIKSVQDTHNIPAWLGEYGCYWDLNMTIQNYWIETWTNIAKVNVWSYSFWGLSHRHYTDYYWDLFFLTTTPRAPLDNI